GPVDLVGTLELGKQDLMEFSPDTAAVPVLQATPAGHAAAAAHFHGEVFPGDAGLEDEEDAGECLAVMDGLASGVAETARLRWREHRLDRVPQFVGEQRLGHGDLS